MSDSNLFVGNLSFKATAAEIRDYFSGAGTVTAVNLAMEAGSGRSRGFAFVEFAGLEEAENAVRLFHDAEFQGRPLAVHLARPRENRPLPLRPRPAQTGAPGED